MSANLGNVKPHVQAAGDAIQAAFGNLTMGGWRATGSVPNSDHPKGLAIDVMTTSAALGNKIAEWAIANASAFNITYIIWNRRIWQNGAWKPYSGPSPHTDHVHISFGPTGGTQNVVNTGSLSANAGCLGKLLGAGSKRNTDVTLSGLFIVWGCSILKWGTPIVTIMAAARFGIGG